MRTEVQEIGIPVRVVGKNKMNKNTHEKVKETEFLKIINEEYQRSKRVLSPMLNGINRSFVKFYWWKRKRAWGGSCRYWSKQIHFNKNYRDIKEGKWSVKQFRLMLRHEMSHLAVKEHGHGARFLNALKIVQGHRFVGEEVYDGVKKK